jgi:hypothetical protein
MFQNDSLLPHFDDMRSPMMGERRIREEATMEFLTSIPAAFGTMAIMVAFFLIVSR